MSRFGVVVLLEDFVREGRAIAFLLGMCAGCRGSSGGQLQFHEIELLLLGQYVLDIWF